MRQEYMNLKTDTYEYEGWSALFLPDPDITAWRAERVLNSTARAMLRSLLFLLASLALRRFHRSRSARDLRDLLRNTARELTRRIPGKDSFLIQYIAVALALVLFASSDILFYLPRLVTFALSMPRYVLTMIYHAVLSPAYELSALCAARWSCWPIWPAVATLRLPEHLLQLGVHSLTARLTLTGALIIVLFAACLSFVALATHLGLPPADRALGHLQAAGSRVRQEIWSLLSHLQSLLARFGVCGLGCADAPTRGDCLEPPRDFICPISMDIMADPVMCADGHSYEREHIERWFAQPGAASLNSPKTGAQLAHRSLLPNHALRGSIEEWQARAKVHAS